MPPVEENEPVNPEPPMRGSIIGIIYPPPEVRNIVDKTASFVARNGIEFENRIRQNEINNPKFNFLGQADPYHAYYQHKVKEFKEGKGQEPSAAKSGAALGTAPQRTQQEQLKIASEPVVPKEPPPEFEFIADPPSISAFDLDVVRLTAQFVARNGRGFLTNLMNREQRNYQFDFLRPQHSLFNYFTKLVEQYTKILIPPKGLMGKLRKECDNPTSVLDQVKYRVEWAKFQQRQKQKEEEIKEKERVAYAQIDWHDFVVVETVDFQPNETGNLPPPTTPDEVGARMLAQERFEDLGDEQEAEAVEMEVESGGESSTDDEEDAEDVLARRETRGPPGKRRGADTTVQDMEQDSDEEQDMGRTSRPSTQPHGRPPPPQADKDKGRQPPMPPMPPMPPKANDTPQPPPLPPTPDQVIIKQYNPKSAKHVESELADYVISPLTGEKIPANKIQEHMKIGLLDPKWMESRDRALAEKREQEDIIAGGSSIANTLENLARRRTDIFFPGDETQIGKMIGEEESQKKPDKIVWDGHTASMEKVSQKARENISIEQQIATIHKTKGLVPDEEKDRIGPSAGRVPGPPSGGPPVPPAGKPNFAPPQPRIAPPVAPPRTTTIAPPQPPKPPMQTAPMGGIPRPPAPPMVAPRMMVVPPRPPMMAMGVPTPVVAVPQPMPPMMGMPTAPMAAPRPPIPPRPPVVAQMGGAKQPAKPSADEPPAKKAKTEDQLIPEGAFLMQHPEGQVTFRVAVPNLPDKPEWKCTGQFISFTLPLTDTVSVIKAKIHETISMPVGKQKLQFEGMFIKDSNSLAFYNLTHNCIISLQLKERGGRKK